MTTSIVWFRRDLRLEDNDVLAHALIMTRTVIPVYIHAPAEDGPQAMSAGERWWLHRSLAALAASLRERGSRLVIRRARTSLAGLRSLVKETGAELVCWHRLYEPDEAAREDAIETALVRLGVTVQTFPGHLLLDPDAVPTGGRPYRAFTTYARATRARLAPSKLRPAPRSFRPVPRSIRSLPLAALALSPPADRVKDLAHTWQPGEAGALRRLRAILRGDLSRHARTRDFPTAGGASPLSPHLHFGEISPARVWRAVAAGETPGAEMLQRELLRREFAHHVQHRFPPTPK